MPPQHTRRQGKLRCRTRLFLETHHGESRRLPVGVVGAVPTKRPHSVGRECRPVCVGSTTRRMLAASAVRQWRPKLEVNLSERQFSVGVPRGGFRCKTSHQMGHCLLALDCCNAFNGAKRAAVLEGVVIQPQRLRRRNEMPRRSTCGCVLTNRHR